MKNFALLLLLSILMFSLPACKTQNAGVSNGKKLKALIVDGQNNHEMWPKTTIMMKQYLEETGLFSVDVERTVFTWEGEKYLADFPIYNNKKTSPLKASKTDPSFGPKFSDYDVIISNFGWEAAPWPEKTQTALETYVGRGGGLVIIHAANNSWPEWLEFNKMIGLGGWGDRSEKDGPYVYYNDQDELVRDESAGPGGAHGPEHEFQVKIRNNQHPITKGMPEIWKHTKDELYDKLRGPAENMEVLATAYSPAENEGSGRNEPMLMTLSYGKGRVFHTPMGHADYSMECVGFITSLTRGTEWAATGKVSQNNLPSDFPTAGQSSKRSFVLKK